MNPKKTSEFVELDGTTALNGRDIEWYAEVELFFDVFTEHHGFPAWEPERIKEQTGFKIHDITVPEELKVTEEEIKAIRIEVEALAME